MRGSGSLSGAAARTGKEMKKQKKRLFNKEVEGCVIK